MIFGYINTHQYLFYSPNTGFQAKPYLHLDFVCRVSTSLVHTGLPHLYTKDLVACCLNTHSFALVVHTLVVWVWAGWGWWRRWGGFWVGPRYMMGRAWVAEDVCARNGWMSGLSGLGWVRGWLGGWVGRLAGWWIDCLIDWRGHDKQLPASNLGSILSLKLLSGSLAKKWRRSCGSCVHASWGRDERVVHGRLNCIMVCHFCLWAAVKTWLWSDPMWSLHVASLCSVGTHGCKGCKGWQNKRPNVNFKPWRFCPNCLIWLVRHQEGAMNLYKVTSIRTNHTKDFRPIPWSYLVLHIPVDLDFLGSLPWFQWDKWGA